LKKLYSSETGAVSVYLILVIVPIFLFVAVFIDFARVKLADRETELAVKAGIRSVMSTYNTDLQKYGLFGSGKALDESSELFRQVVGGNLSGSIEGRFFRYIDTQLAADPVRLTPMYTLANQTVFLRQILEDMKYRAPIEFTLEIADKFKKTGATSLMKQGNVFSKEAEKLEALLEKREEALDDAWGQFEEMHNKTGTYHGYYQTRLRELNDLAELIGLNTIEDVKQSIQNIKDQIQSIRQSISNFDGSLASLLSAAEQDLAGIQSIMSSKAALEQQINDLLSKQNELEKLLENILKYTALLALTKQEVRSNNSALSAMQNGIEASLNEAKQANDAVRHELSALQGGAGASEAPALQANAVFGQVKLLSDDEFTAYQSDVSSISALFAGFANRVESTALFNNDAYGKAEQANDEYRDKSNELYSKRSAAEQKRSAANQDAANQKKQHLRSIQDVLDQAKKALGRCSVKEWTDGDNPLYRRLQGNPENGEQGLYRKYLELNQEAAAELPEATPELTAAKTMGSRAMDFADKLADAAQGVRDELFLNEYVLSKFSYRTTGLEKDSSGNPKPSATFTKPEDHPLTNQEAEYVLYGFSSCAANISSAYAEMFSFRLAIRTLEGLTDPKNEVLQAGSPLLVFLAAVAEGAAKALSDMNRLVKGEEIPISSKITNPALTMGYKDYLRIFLLIHGGKLNRLARLQALIELNTNKDLAQETTYMQGSAAVTVKLWFMPVIAKLLNAGGLFPCRVENGRCSIRKNAVMAY
jgi:hypothetical protein